MPGYSASADLSTWNDEKLERLDHYLTVHGWTYCETNQSLYEINGKAPSKSKGARAISLNGEMVAINRWSLIHFIKTRKALTSSKAKAIYFQIQSNIKEKSNDFIAQFDSLVNYYNDTRSYSVLIGELEMIKNSKFREDVESQVNELNNAIRLKYWQDWVVVDHYSIKDGKITIGLKKLNSNKMHEYRVKYDDMVIKSLDLLQEKEFAFRVGVEIDTGKVHLPSMKNVLEKVK